MKILVVDDEPTIRSVVKELLGAAGYDDVLEASNGEVALALARKEQPVLILLDLVMPEMSGYDVLQEIRKDPRLRNTPILILSVLVSGVDTDVYFHELDVEGFIDKADFMISLVPRVQEILSKQAHQVA